MLLSTYWSWWFICMSVQPQPPTIYNYWTSIKSYVSFNKFYCFHMFFFNVIFSLAMRNARNF
jgi:hypothetical protein